MYFDNDHAIDRPHEECGVFGVYSPGREVARLAFFALYALQHRGQESSGIATSDGKITYLHKGMGLVSQVFNEDNLRPLRGHLAIGQNRYSTTGSSHIRNAQPYLIETFYGPLGVTHNGNLTNARDLRQALLARGVGLITTTDSEVITQMLAAPPDVLMSMGVNPESSNGSYTSGKPVPEEYLTTATTSDRWVARIQAFMQVARGAYSLTLLTRDAIYAVRDPHGLRPLCLGTFDDGGYVVASESCALLTVGARFVRDIKPGEIVRLDNQGATSITGREAKCCSLCIFEYVYFARPDSYLGGKVVHQVRQHLGQQLASESPADADIVVGVPDSATPAAIGFSQQSGIAFSEGLIKNRYIGRTFIQPDDKLRQVGVRLKYNPLTANLQGKRVVLVDDSIVRGNTAGPMVQLLRDAGAVEVHVRVSSPPVCHPCFMGVDMATYNELIAYRMDTEAICSHIGADSLKYLSLEGLLSVIDGSSSPNEAKHCNACFSGCYPIPIPEWLFSNQRDKNIFEQMWGVQTDG